MKNKKSILVRTRHFFYALLVAVIFCGCEELKTAPITTPLEKGKYATIVIDSCEYLQYYVEMKYGNAYTTHDYQTKMITHKGNCKFCAERSKK